MNFESALVKCELELLPFFIIGMKTIKQNNFNKSNQQQASEHWLYWENAQFADDLCEATTLITLLTFEWNINFQ